MRLTLAGSVALPVVAAEIRRVHPPSEEAEGKGNFARIGSAPGNYALELNRIVLDGADLHQLRFDDLFVPAHLASDNDATRITTPN